MKWRCEWCGKPHERNAPPCDNCGHHSLERAVVPKAPEEGQEEYVWVCPECGRDHPRNSPPCSRCGNMQLEQRPLDYLDPGDVGGGDWTDAVEWWHGALAVTALVLAFYLFV
jgi:rRNA maturation endonuclease Nob1